MTPAAFDRSLAQQAPPSDLSAPLASLWWAKKGNWDEAHRLVQDDASREAARVHAYLHRVEGDLGNAAYWYRQASQPVCTTSRDAEWTAILADLLAD